MKTKPLIPDIWKPGMPVLLGSHIAMDTETERFTCSEFPVLACIQTYTEDSDGNPLGQFVWWAFAKEYMREITRANPTTHWYFHNAAFDWGVLDHDEGLFKALQEDRLHDTFVMYTIRSAWQLGFVKPDRTLKGITRDLCGYILDKDESIRLTFTREAFPSYEHITYAMSDPKATYRCAEQMKWQIPTEPLKTRSHIALDAISRRGMLVDEARRSSIHEELSRKKEDQKEILSMFGHYPKTKGVDKHKQLLLEGIEKEMNITFPRTEKSGKISTTNDSLESVGVVDHPFIVAFKEYDHYNKIIGTYLDKSKIGANGRTWARYDLVATGRTSCSKPNLQNLPRAGGIRGMYIPTPNHYLLASDYSQLELCGLAQYCYQVFGYSKLGDTINNGVDAHKNMATFFTHKPIDEITKKERSMAKVANFGFPGGLTPASFVTYAKGMGVIVTEEDGELCYEAWRQAYPEMNEYIESNPDMYNKGMYFARMLSGRERHNCSKPQAMNAIFQGGSSDGASEMLWQCYLMKLKVVNFIHDEILTELRIKPAAEMMEEIRAIEAMMITSMKKIIPDVRIAVESGLMNRWYKEAEDLLDQDGNLQVAVDVQVDPDGKSQVIYERVAQ